MLTRELPSQTLPYLHLSDKVYQALQLMNDNHVVHLPIVDGDRYVGMISEEELLQAENDHDELQTLQQSFSGIAVKEEEHFLRAVQLAAENGLSIVPIVTDENAQITQLNTSNDPETGMMQVTIRINKPEVSDIVATFQRYDYNVKYFFGEELYANELRSNYDNLMNYLKI